MDRIAGKELCGTLVICALRVVKQHLMFHLGDRLLYLLDGRIMLSSLSAPGVWELARWHPGPADIAATQSTNAVHSALKETDGEWLAFEELSA